MSIPIPIPPEVTKSVVDEAIAIFNKLLGPICEATGTMGGDAVRRFRFERDIKLLRRYHTIVTEAGFNPKTVKWNVLFPLLDAAALEDDEDMHERWASLLASSANPNNQSALEASFIEILKQLAPTHAFLLDVFYEQVTRDKSTPDQWNEHGSILSDLKEFLEKEVPDFDVAVENLLRLNLVAFPKAKLGIANGQEVSVQVTSADILCATNLGFAFAAACGHGRTHRNIAYCVPGNSIQNVFWTRGGSLRLTPAPPAEAVPPGAISPELQEKIAIEALVAAQKDGCTEPRARLDGRILRVSFVLVQRECPFWN